MMDHKRKAHAANGTSAAEADDRAAKRRKIPEDFDLTKGETRESTTQYGLAFLEQIRRTADKNGRLVAGYFEKLVPRKENPDYYERIRLPISLETIERKLNNREFSSLSELESYLKRMVANAKEFYPRSSQVFEDAERVRKALSNYMTKTNPAYKLIHGYTAVPTPIPAENELEAEPEDEDEGEGEAVQDEQGEEDAEGDEDDEEANGEDDNEDDEDEDADDDDGAQGSHRSRRPVAGRRRGRPPKDATPQATKPEASGGKGDASYEDVPYKGLSFQQAQEKVVEELLRAPDEDDPEWPAFEAFFNMPSRTIKDYYQLIEEPISLKKLQKFVKGAATRGPHTGVSDFKSWAAFEEKANLLWENAFYYNEEGSEIYNIAQKLKESFYKELQEAKSVVAEPSQPKIKLKASSAQEPAKGPKKITIHVGGRGSSTGSPAPLTAGSVDSGAVEATPNGVGTRASFGGQLNLGQLDKTRSVSASGASPSPSAGVKREDPTQQSPGGAARANGVASTPAGTPGVPPALNSASQTHQPGLPNGNSQPAPPPGPAYDIKYRLPGRGVEHALIKNLCIRSHNNANYDRRFLFNLPAHPKESQQSVTITLPHGHNRLQIIPTLSPTLEQQQRPYKMYVIVNGATLARTMPNPQDPIPAGAILYEAQLHPGIVNTIMVQILAAVPKDEKLPNGADAEFEKFTVLANVLRF